MGEKSQHGTVVVGLCNGRLRLRWSYQGKRYCLPLGLPDSKVNRIVSQGKAAIIEADLFTGNFDQTLTKYKPQRQQSLSNLSIQELLRQFTEYKRRSLETQSLSKFKALRKPIADFFGEKAVVSIDEESADDFRFYLS